MATMGLSHTVSEKAVISVENQKISPPPCIQRPRRRGSHWNWPGIGARGQKTRMMALTGW